MNEALGRLERLIGEWKLEAIGPDGQSWPGKAKATVEWHSSGAHVVHRSEVDIPEAPNSVSIMGCDDTNGTYFQLYSDDRGVCRVYEMNLTDTEWTLSRAGAPMAQRFTATFEDDDTIHGRWELAEDGENFRHDFDLIYRRIK